MAANQDKISLKVMVQKEKNKVIFAEADSNFVDALFSIMTLPMATIIRLLDKCPDENFQSLGSLKNLYQSLMELPTSYLSNDESKCMMLNLTTSSSYDCCRKLKLIIDDSEPTKYFLCKYDNGSSFFHLVYGSYFSTSNFAICPYCSNLMNLKVKPKDPPSAFIVSRSRRDDPGAFVPSLTTFIVTDDLRVMPNSLDFSVRLLCDLGVTDASQMEERTIDIGFEQILILVKAALSSKYPLTYLVFHSIHSIGDLVNFKRGTSIQHLTINEKDEDLKKMTLKLSLQKSTSKFLFAEAEEDFVDFLFGFLEIPLGTLIGKLMDGNTSIECLDNLFASISNMSVGSSIKSQDLKDLLIKPQLQWKYVSVNQIFPLDVSNDFEKLLDRKRTLKDPRIEGRFIKSHTRFLLTDDLVITPISSISGISILNKLKVSLNDVEQHEVNIGIEEGLKILKASLKSSSTFTDALREEIMEVNIRKPILVLKNW